MKELSKNTQNLFIFVNKINYEYYSKFVRNFGADPWHPNEDTNDGNSGSEFENGDNSISWMNYATPSNPNPAEQRNLGRRVGFGNIGGGSSGAIQNFDDSVSWRDFGFDTPDGYNGENDNSAISRGGNRNLGRAVSSLMGYDNSDQKPETSDQTRNQTAQISNQYPQETNQVSQISNQTAQVSNQQPQETNQLPQISNQESQVSNQRPHVSKQRPQLSNQRLQLSNQNPQVSNQEPQVSNQKTHVSNQQPQAEF